MALIKIVIGALMMHMVQGGMKLVDLSHSLNSDNPTWPFIEPFNKSLVNGSLSNGKWYMMNYLELPEHVSTHLDAPSHFPEREGLWHASQIPVERLVCKVSLINLTEKAAANPDYEVTADDITSWEKRFGRIPKGNVVLFDFGWAKKWDSYSEVYGSPLLDATTFHFPGLRMDAAKVLVDRGVYGVGTDTPSIDHGPSLTYPLHFYLAEKNIYFLENVADMSELPEGGKGVTLVVGAMKIDGGSGGPARLIAMFDDENTKGDDNSSVRVSCYAVSTLLVLLISLL